MGPDGSLGYVYPGSFQQIPMGPCGSQRVSVVLTVISDSLWTPGTVGRCRWSE